MSKTLPNSSTDASEFDGSTLTAGVPNAEFDGTVLRGRIIGGDQSSHHTHATADIVSGIMDTARLGSGTATSTAFLRGDSTWIDPPGAQTLSIVGQTLTISNGNDVTLPDVNTTYDLSTLTDSGAVKVRLAGSDSTNDDVTIAGSGATSVAQTGSTITVSSDAYTHPTHDGDDIDLDTTLLSGAAVISDLDFNVTTDASGHVTDASAEVATRNLTLADLGYTGATDANNYTHPAHTGDATGATALTVVKLRGRNISDVAPSNGEVLKWNSTSSEWEPSADNNSGGGGGGGSGHTIQDEGSDLTGETNLNFVGELVTATAESGASQVTIDAKTLWLYAA